MPIPFFAPFFHHFAQQFLTYGFGVTAERHNPGGFGSGQLRLTSERYFLDVTVDGMGPKVNMAVGRHGQLGTDVAWIFAYLTRAPLPAVPGAAIAPAPGLYFYPHLALNIWDYDSVAWQAARLADVLQPLWAAMLIFLDMDGPRSAEFTAFRKRVERAAAERAADGYQIDGYQLPPDAAHSAGERGAMGFAAQAQKSFAFLTAYGFKCMNVTPLMVRFETMLGEGRLGADAGVSPLYITVFHRAQSYALGVHTGLADDSPGAELNFDMEELAAWSGKRYTTEIVRRAEEMPAALNRLSRLYRQMAAPVLGGDMRLLEALLTRRIDAARRASRAWADRNRGR